MATSASENDVSANGQDSPGVVQQIENRTPQSSNKRQKVTRACDTCKSRKRRCTGELPCSTCWEYGLNCTYNASYTRGRNVQPLPATWTSENVPQTDHIHPTNGSERPNEGPTDARTSRTGSPEGEAATLAGQYSGPTSAYSFLRRAWRRFGLKTNQQEDKDSNHTVTIFSYGDKQFPRVSGSATEFRLPDRAVTAELFARYFDFAMPTYRFLHQPTVSLWLETYHSELDTNSGHVSLLPARQAIVLMVLATASLFNADHRPGENISNETEASQEGEPFFHAAQARLASETGKVRLESVQARLAMCLYLLHTSRPNQAWYTFGITVQMLLALGMHRARAGAMPQLDAITSECRKRALWAAFTLDSYLCMILGRPALIHIDDVDQQFPESIDDDDLRADGIIANPLRRDPIIQASIFHAKITLISKKAMKEQYSVHRNRDAHKLSVATRLNAEVGTWRASLPVVLSGAIHPSSLIKIFQRQIIVLELAHSLAVILINRPLLFTDSSPDNRTHVNSCLSAAKTTLDIVLGFVSDKRSFPAFWYTQFVTFNALAIVYVWLIQRKRGRLSKLQPTHTDEELYSIAEAIQKHLAEATQGSAPSLRYSLILEELHQETRRLMEKTNQVRPPVLSGLLESPVEGHFYATPANPSHSSPSSKRPGSIRSDSLGGDFPMDPDLWLQLDSFPFPDIDFEETGNLS